MLKGTNKGSYAAYSIPLSLIERFRVRVFLGTESPLLGRLYPAPTWDFSCINLDLVELQCEY